MTNFRTGKKYTPKEIRAGIESKDYESIDLNQLGGM